MTAKYSTGLRNAMLDTGPLRTLVTLFSMKIYAGAEPASADAALGGATLLTTVTNNATATGLTWEALAVDGVLTKALAEVWRGTNVATGTAAFFRIVMSGDDGTPSTTQYRIQGRCAVLGGDLNFSSLSLTSGAPHDVGFFSVALPTY